MLVWGNFDSLGAIFTKRRSLNGISQKQYSFGAIEPISHIILLKRKGTKLRPLAYETVTGSTFGYKQWPRVTVRAALHQQPTNVLVSSDLSEFN